MGRGGGTLQGLREVSAARGGPERAPDRADCENRLRGPGRVKTARRYRHSPSARSGRAFAAAAPRGPAGLPILERRSSSPGIAACETAGGIAPAGRPHAAQKSRYGVAPEAPEAPMVSSKNWTMRSLK